MNSPSGIASRVRLDQVDALRGIAAISVVLFHFTVRYGQLIPSPTESIVRFPLGFHGVDLFFMISGFVILMTLERTRTAADFVVARFSRLYPAYWCCLLLTYLLSSCLGPALPLISVNDAIANALMFQNMLFHVPHLDGSYWTLDVELLFYICMLVIFLVRQLHRVHHLLTALLALRWVYFLTKQVAGVDLSYTVYRLLNLQFIAWFALGLSIYTLVAKPRSRESRGALLCGAAAIVTIFALESAANGALALVFAALLFGAATQRLRFLQTRALVWLGSVSYPLYLLHENIGWSFMRWLQAHGWTMSASALAALALALALAWLVSRFVEQPALLWIRSLWRRHRDNPAPG